MTSGGAREGCLRGTYGRTDGRVCADADVHNICSLLAPEAQYVRVQVPIAVARYDDDDDDIL